MGSNLSRCQGPGVWRPENEVCEPEQGQAGLQQVHITLTHRPPCHQKEEDKHLEYMQIAVSLDREEGGFLASVSESGGEGERVRIGAGARSCHAPSAGPKALQQYAFLSHSPGSCCGKRLT